MSKRQFAALFLCNLVNYTVGSGLMPLLPVYATRLGAGPVFTGYYMAFAMASLAGGTMLAGWLSDVFQRRKTLLIISGVLGVFAACLTGQVAGIYGLALLTAAVWFLGGVQLSLLGILAGLFAAASERGRIFGILATTAGLGLLVSGLTMGAIADRWGYPTLLLVTGLWWALLPLTALFLEDKTVDQPQEASRLAGGRASALGSGFWRLVLASLVAGVAAFVASMGRSLSMQSLGFPNAAISSTNVVSGIGELLRVPLLGWISDRVDRSLLLWLACLAGAAGLFVLSTSTSLWHFWLAAALQGFLFLGAVGDALVADLVPQESLGAGLSLRLSAAQVGGVIGFAGAGHAIGDLGMARALSLGALLAVIAAGLLVSIRPARRTEVATA